MSTLVHGRPLPPPTPPKRQATDESGEERDTGVRVREEGDAPNVDEAPPQLDAPPLDERPAVTPDALRKPYASLMPGPKKTPSDAPPRPVHAPRPPMKSASGAQSWDETSSLSSSGGKVRSSRAICKQHKIARNKDGVCLLCRKDELQNSGGRGWKVIVVLMALAVLGGGVAAALI